MAIILKCYLIGARTNLYALLFLHFLSMPDHFLIALRLLLLSGKLQINLLNKQNRLQTEVLEGLQHLSFSGVDLARLLFEKVGTAPVLPIVITNGLSWPVLSESHPIQQQMD